MLNFVSERILRFCIESIQKMDMLLLYSSKFAKSRDFGSKSLLKTLLRGFESFYALQAWSMSYFLKKLDPNRKFRSLTKFCIDFISKRL